MKRWGCQQKGNPRWISIQTDRSLQMTNTPFCLFPQGHPRAKYLSGFNTEGNEGASPLAGRRPRLQCAWTSSGTAPEREARTNDCVSFVGDRRDPGGWCPPPLSHHGLHRTNDCVPFVQYPTYDRSYHPSQSAHSIVGTTRRQRMRRLSGLAWPPLL